MSERATLKDVINYVPEQYLSDDEVSLIRSTFKNNPKLINVLRKVLMPTITDGSLTIEQFADDIFGVGRQYAQMPADEAKILTVARQDTITFIAGGLIKLKVIANQEEENESETALRRGKDSTK